MNVTFNYQQLYESLYMANPSFNGYAAPDDVYKIFKSMLNHAQGLKNSENTYPQMQTPVHTQYQTSFPISGVQTIPTMQGMQGMQGQYIPIYNPYMMQMQNQYQQPTNQLNGQMWGYGGYMGMNPYGNGYRH